MDRTWFLFLMGILVGYQIYAFYGLAVAYREWRKADHELNELLEKQSQLIKKSINEEKK